MSGHEHGVRVDVAGGAERGEHLLAEAVRGGDGGGVELRQRPGQASPALRRARRPRRRPGAGPAGPATTRRPGRAARARCSPGARGPGRAARTSPRGRRSRAGARSSSATPSATYRVASAAIVNVLPVPALASSTVVPVGSGPQTSKTAGGPTRGAARRGRRSYRLRPLVVDQRAATAAARARRTGCPPRATTPCSRGARPRGQQVVEVGVVAPDVDVVVVQVLVGTPELAFRGQQRLLLDVPGVPRRGRTRSSPRPAAAAARRARRRAARRARRGGPAPRPAAGRSSSAIAARALRAGDRPTVTARYRRVPVARGEREQLRPTPAAGAWPRAWSTPPGPGRRRARPRRCRSPPGRRAARP